MAGVACRESLSALMCDIFKANAPLELLDLGAFSYQTDTVGIVNLLESLADSNISTMTELSIENN